MSGIIDLFVPREKKFFEHLNRQITILVDCSNKLAKFSNKKLNKNLQKDLLYIQKKSDEADLLSREIVNSLHQTFITPIDREEIISLSKSINFIMDSIEKIASSILYFKIKKIDLHLLKQLKILEDSIETLKVIFNDPLSSKQNRFQIEKIKNFEREGDTLFRKATISLFNNGHSAVEIIKQKELYDLTEDAIDDTKHIADLMEAVLINNS